MAINRSEYINTIKPGLKSCKDFRKFFLRFKVEGKQYYTTFNYSDKNWDKRTRIATAEKEALSYKEKIKNPESELSDKIKLDNFINQYFEKLPNTTWTTTKIRHYNNYIKNRLGNKKVIDIRQMHIKDCIQEQKELGLSARTVKTTLEILNPLFKEAIANRLINFNPCDGITIKRDKTKKTVLNASKELSNIIQVVYELFEDEPFYLSFYLLAIQGRRKSEVLNLKWEHIDFDNNTYLLENTKNGEQQLYYLPSNIKEALLKFCNDTGWVFESSVKVGQRITNVEKQTDKIKQLIPNFTLHRLRNIIVSAMAEQGLSATLMSGALGHNNTSTLSKYLTLNHIKGSESADSIIQELAKGIK